MKSSWEIQPELVTIGERPTGHRIRHCFGPIRGVSARSLGTLRSIAAQWDVNFAGEMPSVASTLDESREFALLRLLATARQLGANSVTHLRFDSEMVGEIMCFVAYGMACIAEPKSSETAATADANER
jgi:uncharacterized protein YbjQ (UPF0145 family)